MQDVSDSVPHDTLTRFKFKSLTSHTNVNLSILEAVLGSSFTRPTYAKARTPKTPAMEKTEVAVNISVAVASGIAVSLCDDSHRNPQGIYTLEIS